jgi:hypothetical protein
MTTIRAALMVLIGLCYSMSARADGAREPVQVDLSSGKLLNPLPFDVPFLINGATGDGLPSGIACVKTSYRRDGSTESHSLDTWRPLPGVGSKAFYVQVNALRPNTEYTFEFTLVRKLQPEEVASVRLKLKERLRQTLSSATGDPTISMVDVFEDVQRSTEEAFSPTQSTDALESSPNVLRKDVCDDASPKAGERRLQLIQEAEDKAGGFTRDAIEAQGKVNARNVSWGARAAAVKDALRGMRGTVARFASALSAAENPSFSSRADAIANLRVLASVSDDEAALLSVGQATLTAGLFKPAIGEAKLKIDQFGAPGLLNPRIEALETSAATLRRIDGFLRQGSPNPALQPDKDVALIKGAAEQLEAVAEELRQMAKSMQKRDVAIDGAVDMGGFFASETVTLTTPRQGTYKANAATYISLDLGLAGFPGLEGTMYAPYTGANIYFRPVNKEAYLSLSDFPGDIFRRLALVVGATVTSVEYEDRRKGLFGHSGLLLGAGIRAQSYLRVSGGWVLFQKLDPNPLKDGRSVAASYFVAASIDVDVANLFGSVRDTVFGK